MGSKVRLTLASVLPLPDKHHFSIKSSANLNRAALASGEYYGLKGSGYLTILETSPSLQAIKQYNWNDVLFDVTWSEQWSDVIVSVSGDGSYQVWEISQPEMEPKFVIKAHLLESTCVEWDVTNAAPRFLTTSWDHTLKVWELSREPICICEISHPCIIHSGQWAPFSPHLIAICGSDGKMVQTDLRDRKTLISATQTHHNDVLSCSWSLHSQFIIATAGCDRYVKIWDTRQLHAPLSVLTGHRQTVKRVKMSPHGEKLVGSCGYDSSWIVWDYTRDESLFVSNWHSGFCQGFDFNRNINGQFYTCAWDSRVVSARFELSHISKL